MRYRLRTLLILLGVLPPLLAWSCVRVEEGGSGLGFAPPGTIFYPPPPEFRIARDAAAREALRQARDEPTDVALDP